MGKHHLSRHWAKHDLGFKFNLGVAKAVPNIQFSVKENRSSAFEEIMQDAVEHPRVVINRYADSDIPLNTVELAEAWTNSLLYHYEFCRCEMCTLRKMLDDPKGVEYDQLWINDVIYPVVGKSVDFTEHHKDCACPEHNELCSCNHDCPCFRYGIHDMHGRFDCRVAPTFKHTPRILPGNEKRYPMVDEKFIFSEQVAVQPYSGANYFIENMHKNSPCFVQPVISDEFDSNELGAQWDSANISGVHNDV